jgi:hypothetical protein
VSFPWGNLITAASTLTAALGGASLTALLSGRVEGRRLAHDRRTTLVSQRTDAYAEFLRIAQVDARLLALACFRFSHGVPGNQEAEKMIDEMSETVVVFQGAQARVEIVGSERAAHGARCVAEAAAQVGLQLRSSFLADRPVDPDVVAPKQAELRRRIAQFSQLCREELGDTR